MTIRDHIVKSVQRRILATATPEASADVLRTGVMSGTRLTILEYPDPRLKTRAQPVAAVDDGLRRLMDDMLATLRATQSLGLPGR